MNGYAEKFDFDGQNISGWALGALQVTAFLSGVEIGTATPAGTREDLSKVVPGGLIFTLHCTAKFTALDVVSGRLEVKVMNGGTSKTLKLTSNGAKRIRHQAIDGLLATAPDYFADTHRTVWPDEDLIEVQPNVKMGRMSAQLLPAGLYSQDKSSVLGLNGQIFLVGGSNRVLDQYSDDFDYGPGGMQGLVDEWTKLFSGRREHLDSLGIRYFQTVIPEKLTAMPVYAPMPLDVPTPIYRSLEDRLRSESFYVSGLEPFVPWLERDDPFLTTGSHFSASGAKEMFAALVEEIDPPIAKLVGAIEMNEVRYEVEDLAERFYGLPLHSRKWEPSAAQFRQWATDLVLTQKYLPAGHIGRRFSWTNRSAPSRLKVLAFGNSFFGSGDIPGQLAWWCKHYFLEFTHVWNPEFDWALVRELKPDVVVGQTIERFLRRVPLS
ncbi:hypothetical protein AB4Y86_08435 [Arthrobacter sp. 2YAF22_2]|uniref:hypothetical protein n=1 Tax=Arthrobacter sp. 2YAF22_2 TaxID=3233029 RepID=UPI003F93B54C